MLAPGEPEGRAMTRPPAGVPAVPCDDPGAGDIVPTHEALGTIRVLLIEDDSLDRALFSERLRGAGHIVVAHPSIEVALGTRLVAPDVVVLDLGLPGIAGWDGIRSLRAAQPSAPVVVLTGHEEPGMAEAALDVGAHDFVAKDDPDHGALDRSIRRAVHRSAFAADRQFEAVHDPLTGLPNRTLLEDRMETLAAIAERNDTKLGVLFIDLDKFKPVNDTHGHHVGDRLLIEFAGRVGGLMRPSDTVARVGGDEFVVLISNVRSDDDVETVVQRLNESMRRPFIDPEVGELEFAASIGVAIGRPTEVEPVTLLVLADRACLDAKSDPQRSIRWSLGGTLSSIVEDRGRIPVTVYYQPIVEGGVAVGHEALARLNSHDGAILEPAEFLHGLRLAGRLPELDLAVMRQALSDATTHDLGELSVNVSPESLRDEVVLGAMVEAIERSDARVTVEITEQALRVDRRIARSLRRLRMAGARLALDDFGAGNADLAKLIDIDVDIVKLDRHFVRRLALPDRAIPVIEGLLAVCDRLGHTVVVEGIERPDQLDRFEALGARRWQGYLASPPRPLAALAELSPVH